MRTVSLLSTILLCSLLLLVSSCDDDDDMPMPEEISMTAQIDGDDWTADMSIIASNTSGTFRITGGATDGTSIRVTVNNFDGVGTYMIQSGTNEGRWTADSGLGEIYTTELGGSGMVDITSDANNQLKGTFSFSANNAGGMGVNVTNGEFVVDTE